MFAPLIVLTLLAFTSVTADTKALVHDKIDETKYEPIIETFSYQASLIYYTSFICGATIISPEWAITTARCADVKNTIYLSIGVGSTSTSRGGSVLDVTKIILHPKYDNHTHDFDFALLKASHPFNYYYPTDVRPIALPKSTAAIHPGTVANVTGWGTTKGGHIKPLISLHHASVTIMPQRECKHVRGKITHRMFCASDPTNPINTCQGDTGGPLVAHKKLIGMVSWGQDCFTDDKPVVYARVSTVSKWIHKNISV